MSSSKRHGFTLIELLIVVAIIAILAAIAVPNFLEAQVRAKVSRARSDMRAVAIAEEAYLLDWNTYTFRDWSSTTMANQIGYQQGLRYLTSPVAYIASVPYDSWGQYWDTPSGYGGGYSWCPPKFEFQSGSAATQQTSGAWNAPNQAGLPADTFMIRSVGPDKYDDTYWYPWANNYINYRIYNETRQRNGTVDEAIKLIYDPSNGTVSVGDIIRVGGNKPAGARYDVLFASASK
ncbi:prepilin-type N-terminal cleavage/methylation domain-containing protein [Candidatus Sumerlaeota bacterium]|nr:prepilin-type N-terminal cleavage/methylation domain-containing protein [Candidatus Sumerlaeota bacterium]